MIIQVILTLQMCTSAFYMFTNKHNMLNLLFLTATVFQQQPSLSLVKSWRVFCLSFRLILRNSVLCLLRRISRGRRSRCLIKAVSKGHR